MIRSRLCLWSVVVASASCSLLGCSGKNQEKCDEAIQTTRKALQLENTQSARQWRERAYTYCEAGSSLQALDGELVKTEQAISQRKLDEDTRKNEANQLIGIFVDWAGKNRTTADRAGVSPQCQGPEENKQRWCEASRKVGEKYKLTTLYWEQDVEAALFKTRLPLGFDCSALGEHRILKSWNVDATKKSHCEITGGPLAGLHAVVSSVPTESEIRVFTPKYLERDANLKAQLGT